MKNQVLSDYLFHLAPAFLVPAIISVFDDTILLQSLIKMGLLFPLLMLAMKGLGSFFPAENLPHRSTARLVEYAVLQALVFATFMLFFTDLLLPDQQSGLAPMFRQFAVTTIVMATVNVAVAFLARKRLNGSDAR